MRFSRFISTTVSGILFFAVATAAPDSATRSLSLAQSGASSEQLAQLEREDLGVKPSAVLQMGDMFRPTPTELPGGQVITTQGLLSLMQGKQSRYVLFDVLGQAEALPQAVPAAWMGLPGSFSDGVQQSVAELLARRVQGRKEVALVFYCQSRWCWMSYNAALRAIHAGHTRVMWYRGGMQAWTQAGLPTQPQLTVNPLAQRPPPGPAYTSAGVRVQFEAVAPLVGADGGLRVHQAHGYAFALPPWWRLMEETSPMSLTLMSPDNQALVMMRANDGLYGSPTPLEFLRQQLSALRVEGLRIGRGRVGRGIPGFSQPVEFDIGYVQRCMFWNGVATVSQVQERRKPHPTMVMTAALAPAIQWAGYEDWLPRVADLFSFSDSNRLDTRVRSRRTLQHTPAYAEAERLLRERWSMSPPIVDRQPGADPAPRLPGIGGDLRGVRIFPDPFGGPAGPWVMLPPVNAHFWINLRGEVLGTDDSDTIPATRPGDEWRRLGGAIVPAR